MCPCFSIPQGVCPEVHLFRRAQGYQLRFHSRCTRSSSTTARLLAKKKVQGGLSSVKKHMKEEEEKLKKILEADV